MIHEILNDFATARARVFEDRSQTIGASEVGQCARKVFFIKMEHDPGYGAMRDPDYVEGWGATVRGAIFEDSFWVPAMRARFGDQLLYAGAEQQTLTAEFLSATPDGLITGLSRDALAHLSVLDLGESGEIVIECKTVDPRTKLGAPKLEHSYQAQVQMGLLRELTTHRPNFALISYTNASFWDDVVEFVVAFDSAIYANAKERAARIALAGTANELKPEGWIAGGAECAYCPFTHACGRMRTAVPNQADGEADPQLVAELTDLAREAKQLEADVDAVATKLRGLHEEIKERLRTHGLRRIASDGVRIT